MMSFKISGGIDWRASAVNDVKVQCEIEVKKNTSLWTKDPDTGYLKPPRDILDNLCPENCSGQGICVNGKSEYFTNHFNIFERPI